MKNPAARRSTQVPILLVLLTGLTLGWDPGSLGADEPVLPTVGRDKLLHGGLTAVGVVVVGSLVGGGGLAGGGVLTPPGTVDDPIDLARALIWSNGVMLFLGLAKEVYDTLVPWGSGFSIEDLVWDLGGAIGGSLILSGLWGIFHTSPGT